MTQQQNQCPACGAGGENDLPFWYFFAGAPGQNTVTIVAANGTTQATLSIDNDFDFICDRIIASATGLFSISLLDRFRSQWMMPSQVQQVFGENCSGSAQLPFRLPRPVRFPKTSSIQAYFTDRSGAGGNAIQFALVGYKDASTGAAATT